MNSLHLLTDVTVPLHLRDLDLTGGKTRSNLGEDITVNNSTKPSQYSELQG